LTPLDFPGATETFAVGINDSGTVVGYWDILDSNGNVVANHGFIWTKGTFNQIDFPGSSDTEVFGVNTSTNRHGFVCSNRGCLSLDVPSATLTQADDIGVNGVVVGVYANSFGVFHGFEAVGGGFITLDFPGATTSVAWGINATGQIVGDYYIRRWCGAWLFGEPETRERSGSDPASNR